METIQVNGRQKLVLKRLTGLDDVQEAFNYLIQVKSSKYLTITEVVKTYDLSISVKSLSRYLIEEGYWIIKGNKRYWTTKGKTFGFTKHINKSKTQPVFYKTRIKILLRKLKLCHLD